MSNCNCNSLSCGRVSPWRNRCGNCGCNTCGCVASDGTPACNPWAPWGRTAGDFSCRGGRCNWWGCGSCGRVAGDSTCNSCGWNRWGCGSCGSVAGDSTCSSCGCNQWGCGSCGSIAGDSTCSSCGCVAGDSTCGSCGCTGADAGCLVPRLFSIGRTFQRRITQTLCVDDIPDCAESPLTLVSVTVSGQASWEQISECRQQLLRVTVPVSVQIRDCSGRCRTGHSTVTLTIPLCRQCPPQDFWRGQLYVAPCIRLAAPVTENEDGCFDATLEVQAEVFHVRMQIIDC